MCFITLRTRTEFQNIHRFQTSVSQISTAFEPPKHNRHFKPCGHHTSICPAHGVKFFGSATPSVFTVDACLSKNSSIFGSLHWHLCCSLCDNFFGQRHVSFSVSPLLSAAVRSFWFFWFFLFLSCVYYTVIFGITQWSSVSKYLLLISIKCAIFVNKYKY